MNGRVGPHEGREFALYAAGKKDLIYIAHDAAPEVRFAEANGLDIAVLRYRSADSQGESLIGYRPGHRQQAERLRDLILRGTPWTDREWQRVEREIGTLLGYSDADIDAFIRHVELHLAQPR
ncbi:MAG: hypothetical protein AAF460_07460 [Pseudomonadota bacterium]